MSRVIQTIEIEGQPAVALFDSGAFHSYVVRRLVEDIPHRLVPVARPYEVALGGANFTVRAQQAIVNGKIDGLDFDTMVVPVGSLGLADRRELDAIIVRDHHGTSGNHGEPQGRIVGPGWSCLREFTDFVQAETVHREAR